MAIDLILFNGDNDISGKLGFITQKIILGKEIVFGSVESNRKLIESKKVKILVSPHLGAKKDFMNFRNSGLNDVLCKLAKKNKVSVGFDFSEILSLSGFARAEALSRMRQNVRLCGKYGVSMSIFSLAKEPYELRAKDALVCFGRILGMKENQIKIGL